MSAVIWMHEDALRADHPVADRAGEGARSVFIWDDVYFAAQDYSLKRLTFIYECACYAGAEIYRGDTVEVLKALDATALFTADTPNPNFQTVIHALDITVIAEETFVDPEIKPDLKRFFRYWKAVKQSAMARNGDRS